MGDIKAWKRRKEPGKENKNNNVIFPSVLFTFLLWTFFFRRSRLSFIVILSFFSSFLLCLHSFSLLRLFTVFSSSSVSQRIETGETVLTEQQISKQTRVSPKNLHRVFCMGARASSVPDTHSFTCLGFSWRLGSFFDFPPFFSSSLLYQFPCAQLFPLSSFPLHSLLFYLF